MDEQPQLPAPGAPERRRRVLIEPYLQLKLGFYGLALSLAFAVSLLGILHAQWVRFQGWLALHGIDAQARQEIVHYLWGTGLWLAAATVVFLVAHTLVSVLATHRLVGPTYAFRRHVRALIQGDTAARTRLRTNDAFRELADDLNRLSEALAQREAKRRAEEGAP